MIENNINKYQKGSLVIYHNSPAIITEIETDKITLELKNNKTKKVRLKDIVFLYLGPINDLNTLETELDGDVESAWELIDGETLDLDDLADFIYGETSATALWKAWEVLQEGLYFSGTIEEVIPNSKESINEKLQEQKRKENSIIEWSDYIKRIENKAVIEEDLIKLREIEQIAFGKDINSKTMKEINLEANTQKAHQLLLDLDIWNDEVNPYPKRFNCLTNQPNSIEIELPYEERLDLTHLESFAIDGEHTKDPDDAISLDGEYLWVHIADVASIITPNSELDMDARERGATLYLPEKTIGMIPLNILNKLALGLGEKSPALSFKIKINNDGKPVCEKISPSLIKVTRISYNKANTLMEEEPFLSINNIIKTFRKRRKENGAMDILLPEVDLHVAPQPPKGGVFAPSGVEVNESSLKLNSSKDELKPEIKINNIEPLASREMVVDAMLMTGEAVADWLFENNIPVPYVSQNSPLELMPQPKTMSGFLAYLKTMQKSKLSLLPDIHAGLGLDKYVRVTSPLRRYSDLLVHQQIRAFLSQKELMNSTEMENRMTEAEFTSSNCNMAGRLSTKHWKLYYIKHFSNKEFTGVLVDKRGNMGFVTIPELAIDVKIQGASSIELDTELKILITDVNMSKLDLFARVVK